MKEMSVVIVNGFMRPIRTAHNGTLRRVGRGRKVRVPRKNKNVDKKKIICKGNEVTKS